MPINLTISYRGTYASACEMIKELEAVGLSAGVTVGGVWVFAENDDVDAIGSIVSKYEGAEISPDGLTNMQKYQLRRLEEKKAVQDAMDVVVRTILK